MENIILMLIYCPQKTLILEGCPTTPDETDNCQQAAHGDNDDTNLKEHGVLFFLGRIYYFTVVNKYHCCKCYHCNSYKLAKVKREFLR